MPVYEYACDACDRTFEKLVFHEEGQVRCPECAGEVRKLFSSFSSPATSDDVCSRLSTAEQREACTECRHGGSACPMTG